MPIYSFVDYTGNGSQVDFTIPFSYLDRTHVGVTLNGVAQTLGVHYSFFNATTIRFNVAPGNTVPLRIKRTTPLTASLVDFTNGVNVQDTDLDTVVLQNLYVTQEQVDFFTETLKTDPADGLWDATNKRIKRVTAGTANDHAVNKQQMDAADAAMLVSVQALENEAQGHVADAAVHSTAAASSAVLALNWSNDASAWKDIANGAASAAAASAAEAAVSAGAAPNFVGAIVMYGGASDPAANWLLCDGRALNRTTYAALFAALGTAYGVGDGSTTFNIPDMRGRQPIGAGQGSGLTNRTRGQTFGEETHQLTIAEMPAHDHTVQTTTEGGTTGIEAGTSTPAGSGTTDSRGGGAAHNVMDPSLVVNFVIRVS